MKKAFITVLCIAAIIETSYSQDSLTYSRFDYTGNEFSSKMNEHTRKFRNTLSGYLGNTFALDKNFALVMDTTCESGVALIKFKVKDNGVLTNLACTRSTPPVLAKIFKDAVAKSAKYWKAKGNANLYYILPVHYNFTYNCGDKEIKMKALVSDYIYNFDDGIKVEETPCIILRSYKFSAGIKEEDGLPPFKK